MSVIIRKIEEKDLTYIYELYNGRKSVELHKWLYSYDDNGRFNGYIALKNNKVIGCIGYTKTQYNLNGELLTGIVPHSFIVNKNDRGVAGLKLLKATFKDADFYLTVDGSEQAIQIFKALGFVNIGFAKSAQKIIRPFALLRQSKDLPVKKHIKYVHNILRNTISSVYKLGHTLMSVEVTKPNQAPVVANGYFHNALTPSHISWLEKSPFLNIVHLHIEVEPDKKEHVICNIHYNNGNTTAQITHYPPLLYCNKTLTKFFLSIEQFLLKEYGVTQISMMVSDQNTEAIIKKLNYKIERKSRPLNVKAAKPIENQMKSLKKNICFSECDESLRNL